MNRIQQKIYIRRREGKYSWQVHYFSQFRHPFWLSKKHREKYIHLKHNGNVQRGLASKRYNVSERWVFMMLSKGTPTFSDVLRYSVSNPYHTCTTQLAIYSICMCLHLVQVATRKILKWILWSASLVVHSVFKIVIIYVSLTNWTFLAQFDPGMFSSW